jgi:hypothetical protein
MDRYVMVGSILMLTLVGATGRATAAQQLVTEMSSKNVEEAIQLAGDEKMARRFLSTYVVQSRAGWGNGPLLGSFSTPFARVVQAALAAQKTGKTLAASDISSEMIAPELHVIAMWQQAALDDSSVAAVQSVVIADRGDSNAAAASQSLRQVELTREYKELYGVESPERGVVAVFPLSVLKAGREIRVSFDKIAEASNALTACKDCVVTLPNGLR